MPSSRPLGVHWDVYSPTFSRKPFSNSGNIVRLVDQGEVFVPVPPDYAIPDRTHEEDRRFATQSSRTHPVLFPRSKATAMPQSQNGVLVPGRSSSQRQLAAVLIGLEAPSTSLGIALRRPPGISLRALSHQVLLGICQGEFSARARDFFCVSARGFLGGAPKAAWHTFSFPQVIPLG
jgi:hypothetical protein